MLHRVTWVLHGVTWVLHGVTYGPGCVLANTRPHQVHRIDQEWRPLKQKKQSSVCPYLVVASQKHRPLLMKIVDYIMNELSTCFPTLIAGLRPSIRAGTMSQLVGWNYNVCLLASGY